MDVSASALNHVNDFWSMLDEMAQNNPDEYKTFIARQMRDGAEYFSPPEPNTCLCASVQKPHHGMLYVNVCSWKRVPAPGSPTQPVPVCGGKLESISQSQETQIWRTQLTVQRSRQSKPAGIIQIRRSSKQASVRRCTMSINYTRLNSKTKKPKPKSHANIKNLGNEQATQSKYFAKTGKIYNIVDVAFNPEVLHRAEKNSQEKEQIHLLALNFIQKQHKLSLSQHYTVMKAKLKGSLQDMKHRLMSLHRPLNQDNSEFKPAQSLLQQISSLRIEEEESCIQLKEAQEDKEKVRPGLIEVISSTEIVPPQQPKHQMTVCSLSSDSVKRIKLCVELPEISSVSQCQLSISQNDIMLEVEQLYFLHLWFPERVKEDTCHATFNKKKHILTVTISVL